MFLPSHKGSRVLASQHSSLASGAEIVDLLLALNAEHGTTLVIATHDPAIAERCHHVIRMRDGRIAGQPPLSVNDDAPAAKRAWPR
jgi:ABC-type lipoprotein export system ATPase subunit